MGELADKLASTSSYGRGFTAPGKFRNKDVSGTIEYQYSVTGLEDLFADMYDWVHDRYVETSRHEIEIELGTDPTTYELVVDGRKKVPLEVASLQGSGIIAGRQGDVSSLKKAFENAMNYLRSTVPAIFKRSTGYYQTSAGTASFFTVLVNGDEVHAIDWKEMKATSNIQIYSKARYASPVESMHHGRILLGARNAAKAVNGINASFTYRNPSKFHQVGQSSRRGGEPFPMLAVPVLEIGTILSNVTNYVGNISFNLERDRKRQRPNMIERNILPESRSIPRRLRNRPPRR